MNLAQDGWYRDEDYRKEMKENNGHLTANDFGHRYCNLDCNKVETKLFLDLSYN